MIYGITLKGVLPYNSMENRTCTNCKKEKTVEEFKGMNKTCEHCLEIRRASQIKNREKRLENNRIHYLKNKQEKYEYNKEYRKLEVFCEVCKCNVKQYRMADHIRTFKHKNNLIEVIPPKPKNP